MKLNFSFIVLAFLFAACKQKNEIASADNTRLFPNPVSVTLNTAKGYTTNPITGDSIKPIINLYGDTVKTGVSFPFTAISSGNKKNLAVKKNIVVASQKKIIQNNIHPLPSNLTTIVVDTTQLKKVIAGKGVTTNATGRKMPFAEPYPVKALPPRFKENATANVQYLDVDQGMSASYVYCILEDKKGNIWFGTDGGGISKYDGVTFIHYNKKAGLSGNTVTSLLEDKKGNIWIGTTEGLNKFDGNNFTQYKEAPCNTRIHSLTEDSKGNIWFGTSIGLTRYNGTHFTNYTTKDGLPNDNVWACIEDRNGNMWVGTNNGAAKFKNEQFTHYYEKDGLTNAFITSLLEDSKGNIWLGAKSGINKFDGKNIVQYSKAEGLLDDVYIFDIKEDKSGNIWFSSTFGGLTMFDGKAFTNYNQAEGVSNNKVKSFIIDNNGNIWFGTDGGGVNKLNDQGLNYLSFNEVLATNRVRPIIKDIKGNIWFGTEGNGIGKYNTENFPNSSTTFTYYTNANQLMLKGQRSLLEDKNGNIWIGSTEGGIYKFDGHSFTGYSENEKDVANTIFFMLEDKAGNIWFAKSNDGISKYDGTSFINYSEKEGLAVNRIFSMYEDKNGILWIGTDGGGLARYDGKELINYTEKEGMFGKSITSIIGNEDGSIWLSTLGAGVCKFDARLPARAGTDGNDSVGQGKQFTYYTEKEGLSNNNVWSLIKDSGGNIWAGTDKGLNQFVNTNNNYVIYKYGLQDGLKAIDFNLHSACIDNNNRIWWGTGKNIVIKDLNKPFSKANVQSPVLSYIEINDRFYDYHNFPDSMRNKISFTGVAPFTNYPANLKISHDQNHLSFNFSAIDWSAPHKINYSYRLLGWADQWSKPGEETKAEFRNLNFGKYEFQVRAVGQSQVWTTPYTFTFIIRPAWWQTWWFKTLVILLALALVFFIGRFIYFYKMRKERAALEKKLAVQYERQRISAEMHDDIGAGLSGIRLLTEMTKNKIKNEKGAEEVDKIYESVGDISSKMKEVIWSLNMENDNLPNLLSYIQKQVRLWLEHYPCQLTMQMPDTIPDKQINGEARRNIFLIVKEAIHNIIKHSGGNKVNINMTCSKEQLFITITDNGKGMKDEQANESGNGMKNMRQRIEKLQGQLVIINKEGLTLTFEIPI